MAKRAKVVLPSSSHQLRIPDELAGHFGAGCSGAGALVVNSFGKVWQVEVGRDGGGAFLGRGWPEFVAAHGIGAVGWFLVLRHEGSRVLTVKAFDTTCCLREFGRSLTVETTQSSIGCDRRPQFITVLQRGLMEKMPIPAEFVHRYIFQEQLNTQMAIVSIPQGKHWRVELEKDRSNVFFAGGWARFLGCHGITETDVLMMKYEGNVVFTVKVFGHNGCQKEVQLDGLWQTEKKITEARSQQQAPSSTSKGEWKNEMPNGKDPKSSKKSLKKVSSKGLLNKVSPKTYLNKASARRICDYEIGPPSWIKKEINRNSLEQHLCLTSTFCNAIGFREPTTITLKTSMDSTKSWQMCIFPYENSSHQIRRGWKIFCQENKLKEGSTSLKPRCGLWTSSCTSRMEIEPGGILYILRSTSLKPRCGISTSPCTAKMEIEPGGSVCIFCPMLFMCVGIVDQIQVVVVCISCLFRKFSGLLVLQGVPWLS